MSPAVRRAVITTLVLFIVSGIVAITIASGGGSKKQADAPSAATSGTDSSSASSVATPATTPSTTPAIAPATETPSAPAGAASPTGPSQASPAQESAASPPAPVANGDSPPAPTTRAKSTPRSDGYSSAVEARTPGRVAPPHEDDLAPLGSLDPAQSRYRLRFHPRGAGLRDVVFSLFWKTAGDRIAFETHERAVRAGRASPPPMPPESERYVLQTIQRLGDATIPLLAAIDVDLDGELVKLLDDVWTQTAPGVFETEIVDVASGAPLARIQRRFEIAGGLEGFGAGYDLRLVHRVENLGEQPITVRLSQCGPGDLTLEAGGIMDTRRFQFGYLYSPQRDPSRQFVIVHGATEERSTVLSRIDAGNNLLWPTPAQREAGYEISWFGTTNRYFALAVHAPFAPPQQPSKSLAGGVAEVLVTASRADPAARTIFSALKAPSMVVPARSSSTIEIGVFAGPLDPRILDRVEPFASLNLGGLILYQMSGCCSWCTFAWLASGIVHLLLFLHDYVVFDWGLAIIVLVALVRTLLHPLTKHSQVTMQRFARGMQELKPQIDAIQKRYADDPARLREEMARLYRERGVNPVGCVGGMLPTLLQTPIWIALYAVLYFAFSLRQEPAFFGVFQLFGGWQFLGDLSAPDHFITFPSSINLWLFSLEGINLLPILMGVVFWISQKYMTPPPTTKLTPEQEAQQRMMKWMMVIIFPIGMFKMPAGLTLYILTSSAVGIIEGRIVRKQIERMDLSPKAPPKKKKQDLMGRMYEKAMDRARERQKGPPKKYKER